MNLLGATQTTPSQGLTDSGDNAQSNQPVSNNGSLENNFLTMLTAELRNQDPMNPMDSTQMVTQLSQISTSQGIADLKKLSQTEIMALMGNQRLESSELINKDVDYKTNSLDVNDKSSNFSGTVQQSGGGTGDITLTITDQNGKTINSMTVPAGADGDYDWQWNGKDQSGAAVANGTYHISAKASDGSGADVLVENCVHRIDFTSDGNTRLIFNNGQSTDIQDVATIES